MTRNWMMCLTVLCASLALSFVTAPQQVRADEAWEKRMKAGSCAVRYWQLQLSERAPEIIAGFSQEIVASRATALMVMENLVDQNEPDFWERFDAFARGWLDFLVLAEPADLIVLEPEGLLHEDLDSGDASREQSAISALAECDRLHGFMPVVARKGIDHLQCTVSYYMLGAMRSDLQGVATPRIQLATRAHIQATPGANVDDVRRNVPMLARTRGLRIQNGEESLESLIADVRACDTQYGLDLINP